MIHQGKRIRVRIYRLIYIKSLFVICLGFAGIHVMGQSIVTHDMPSKETTDTVSFNTKFDIHLATKDGYYVEGHVVHLDSELAKKLHGKNVRITGRVTIVPGIDIEPAIYDKDGNILATQGRRNDTPHILQPVIEILDY